jgi:hypothetical protein
VSGFLLILGSVMLGIGFTLFCVLLTERGQQALGEPFAYVTATLIALGTVPFAFGLRGVT